MTIRFRANVRNPPTAAGGKPFFDGYRCLLRLQDDPSQSLHDVEVSPDGGACAPGQDCLCRLTPFHPEHLGQLKPGDKFWLLDGNQPRAPGQVTEVTDEV